LEIDKQSAITLSSNTFKEKKGIVIDCCLEQVQGSGVCY